jgi:crotonobetainyl-CoA:carnitine CoA-transferase CaiB-like acyl-CoA transferase
MAKKQKAITNKDCAALLRKYGATGAIVVLVGQPTDDGTGIAHDVAVNHYKVSPYTVARVAENMLTIVAVRAPQLMQKLAAEKLASLTSNVLKGDNKNIA